MTAQLIVQRLRERGLSYYQIAKGAGVYKGVKYRDPDTTKVKRWHSGSEPRASEYQRLVTFYVKHTETAALPEPDVDVMDTRLMSA